MAARFLTRFASFSQIGSQIYQQYTHQPGHLEKQTAELILLFCLPNKIISPPFHVYVMILYIHIVCGTQALIVTVQDMNGSNVITM